MPDRPLILLADPGLLEHLRRLVAAAETEPAVGAVVPAGVRGGSAA